MTMTDIVDVPDTWDTQFTRQQRHFWSSSQYEVWHQAQGRDRDDPCWAARRKGATQWLGEHYATRADAMRACHTDWRSRCLVP